jgi:hypothetical protein
MAVNNAPRFAEKDYVLECIEGKDASNAPVFAYVLLQKKKLAALHQALKAADTDLAKFGLIVASGNGPKPDMEFERQLIASLQKKHHA